MLLMSVLRYVFKRWGVSAEQVIISDVDSTQNETFNALRQYEKFNEEKFLQENES